MDIKNKIAEIITHTHKTPFEQAEEILQLFAKNNEYKQLLQSRVVGQSEQLADFCKKVSNQEDCPDEFQEIVNKEFWNLIR